MVPLGRRGFLKRASAGAMGLAGLVGTSSADAADAAFDPARHGFGFPNWSASDTMYQEHKHVAPDAASVKTQIENEWSGIFEDLFGVSVTRLPRSLLNVIAQQLTVSVGQLSASNGHCYGMSYAAQRYFESSSDLPEGIDTAAEVHDPEIPLGSDEGPIGDLVDYLQRSQILNVYSWVGRRRMIHPQRIDYEAELAALVAVLDAFGTAGLTLVDTETRISHQVLAYDYRKTSAGTKIAIYDPNFSAQTYRDNRRELLVRLTEPMPVSEYGDYNAVVFNRWDRAIQAGVKAATPQQSDERDDFGHLLSRVVRVTVASPDTSLAVVGPDGTPVGRNSAEYMDREPTDVWATRYRYNAPIGDYRIAIVGKSASDYRLGVEVAGLESGALETARSVSVAPGEIHEYNLNVPEDGTPTLSRIGDELPDSVASLNPTSLALGAAGGAALAYLIQRR